MFRVRARLFFNTLILTTCAALTACGGGGGGGGGGGNGGNGGGGSSVTDPINSYFPTDANPRSYEIGGGATTSLTFTDDSVIKISGVRTQVHALNYPATGGKEYFVTANDKISLQGLYFPQILTSGSSYTADARFSAPLEILNTTAAATPGTRSVNGSGKVKISGYDSRSLSYSGTITYVGAESVVSGTTTYATKHISINLSMSATVEGTQFTIPYTVDFWLADGTGIVKRVQASSTYLRL